MARRIDRTIWLATIAIMIIGLAAIYSASSQSVRVTKEVFYDQFFCALLGLAIMSFLSRFDYKKFYDFSYVLYISSVVFLTLVLVMGRYILGARRWIEIGSINFQPSEFAKFALILILSRYFSNHVPSQIGRGRNFGETVVYTFIFPLFLMAVPALLIFKQPDLGTAILIFLIFLILLFVNGVKVSYLLSFLGMCSVCAPFAWHILKPYQKARLSVFLNPNADPLGAGYTIIQSKIAVGSGMLFGRGWLSGTQNQLNFLPERHTDFIFSVIGEEWGLLGALFLILCFYVIVDRGLLIAQNTKDRFGFSLASGIVTLLAIQAVINIGMVLGLFPVVGITLPMVSYGRSSFLTFVVMMGILLNLNRKQALS